VFVICCRTLHSFIIGLHCSRISPLSASNSFGSAAGFCAKLLVCSSLILPWSHYFTKVTYAAFHALSVHIHCVFVVVEGATSRFIRQKLMFNLAPIDTFRQKYQIPNIAAHPFPFTYFYGLFVHKLSHYFDVVHGTRHDFFCTEYSTHCELIYTPYSYE
jgi:hypothetical protein